MCSGGGANQERTLGLGHVEKQESRELTRKSADVLKTCIVRNYNFNRAVANLIGETLQTAAHKWFATHNPKHDG